MNRSKIIKIIHRQIPSWLSDADDSIVVETDEFIQHYTLEENTDPIRLYFTMTGPEETVWSGKKYRGYILYGPKYPLSPPDIFFIDKLLHPNVYLRSDIFGKLCISILHEGADPYGAEDINLRWTPAHNINTILRSAYTLFYDPACDSPANVDVSKLYLKNKAELLRRINEESSEDVC